jgi:hypothetical protein
MMKAASIWRADSWEHVPSVAAEATKVQHAPGTPGQGTRYGKRAKWPAGVPATFEWAIELMLMLCL